MRNLKIGEARGCSDWSWARYPKETKLLSPVEVSRWIGEWGLLGKCKKLIYNNRSINGLKARKLFQVKLWIK